MTGLSFPEWGCLNSVFFSIGCSNQSGSINLGKDILAHFLLHREDTERHESTRCRVVWNVGGFKVKRSVHENTEGQRTLQW